MKSHEKSNMYEYVDGINKFEQAIMKMDFQCFLVQTLLKYVAGNKNKMRDEFVCWSAVCVELFFVFTSNTVQHVLCILAVNIKIIIHRTATLSYS